jgi:glutathione peroxidase
LIKAKSKLYNLMVSAMVLTGARSAVAAAGLPSFTTLGADTIDGVSQAFSAYKGKVVLVVNVASRCGFTGQYEELEALYQKHKDEGLVILGFPSNDFGGQEPGTNDEIKKFCSTKYNVTFPIFSKGPVTGAQIQPVFKYLTVDAGPSMGGPVLWNFEKFLIDRNGRLVNRFRSVTSPASAKFSDEVLRLLRAKAS